MALALTARTLLNKQL